MIFHKIKQSILDNWASFLVTLLSYLIIIYILIVTISVSITAYILFDANDIKNKLIAYVNENTGLTLKVGDIDSKLDKFYMPEIVINDISLINGKDVDNATHIDQVDLVLGLDSLWKFQPIFSKIAISGANLNVSYEADDSILLNGIKIVDPEDETLDNTKSLPFDVEGWLLRQNSIKLHDIKFAFVDHKNNLPPIALNKIDLNLDKGFWSKHYAELSLYGKNCSSVLAVNLFWQGGKFETWQQWEDAELTAKAYSSHNKNESDDIVTAVSALVKNNELQYIHANFDLKNFKAVLAGVDVFNLPEFGGVLDVNLSKDNKYTILSNNFSIITSSGALFDKTKIIGEYFINKYGFIEISNANLLALNNFLNFFNSRENLKLSGIVEKTRYDWIGNVTTPDKYDVSAKFNDISLLSKESDIPSISHVYGDIKFNQESGNVSISLKNSVLNYNSIFLIPYEFNYLNTSVNWSINNKKIVKVQLNDTTLQTKDFTASANGYFVYDPNNPESPSYIDMTAHADKVLTSKVGDYLPIQIPMSVHKWLNMALIGGYAESADMILRGPLGGFPFEDNSGLFYITANIDNAKLRYVESWPTIDNIYGQFILRNTNITVKANKASANNNSIDKALAIIPNFSAVDGVKLFVDGNAHGATDNFMSYLKNSPINNLIGKFPEKINTTGNGTLKIHLDIPFNNPHETKVNGTYTFIDNGIDFIGIPVPPISSVNGDLDFTQHGVSSKGLSLVALNSAVKLTATNPAIGEMIFNAEIPNLDYKTVSLFYLPAFSNIVNGKSLTNLQFEIGKGGIKYLDAKSTLKGVAISAPLDIFAESKDKMMNLRLYPSSPHDFSLDWSLANGFVKGDAVLDSEAYKVRSHVAIGNTMYLPFSDDELSTLNVNLPSINIIQWISFVNELMRKNSVESADDVNNYVNKEGSIKHKRRYEALPLKLHAKSPEFSLGSSVLGNGSVNLVANKEQSYFNFYTPITSGSGYFIYHQKEINLNIDKYMIYKKLPKSGTGHQIEHNKINFINGSSHVVDISMPNINLNIANLFFQNHNLGSIAAYITQSGRNLYLKNGSLSSNDMKVIFNAVNYCFGCNNEDSYVELNANAKIKDFGNVVSSLDFGKIINGGNGSAKMLLQWNGGFQDFNVFKTVGRVKANLHAGKFIKVDPGLFGTLFSIINMQGLFEFGSGDVRDIFKKGFYFNYADIDLGILTSRLEIKNLDIDGPTASLKSIGIIDFSTNTIQADFAVSPKVGFAIAIAAGVATLNPLVGLAVYGAELVTDDIQNKLLTLRFYLSGDLRKPKIERSDTTDNIFKNMNSTIGRDW